MTPDVCVLWRDREGPVVEGGRARRVNLVKGLGGRAQVHRLPVAGGDEVLPRALAYLHALALALVVAARTPAASVLVFFPDLPAWMPARRSKVPLALAWLALLKLVLVMRGRALVVDVGDIPRYQCISLRYELPAGTAAWWVMERVLFRLADRVAVTNEVIGSWIARDHGLPPGRVRVVLNGAPRELLAAPRVREPGPTRFVYVGGLDGKEDRGIRALCRAFAARAPGDAELLLIGPGGEWIETELAIPGVRMLGAMPEERTFGWLTRADFALIPYPTDGYYPAVCPTKLPLYALARVPILSTDNEVPRRIIERHGLGEVLPVEEFFARWPALAEKYRGFSGGRDLDQLTWDATALGLLG